MPDPDHKVEVNMKKPFGDKRGGMIERPEFDLQPEMMDGMADDGSVNPPSRKRFKSKNVNPRNLA